MQTIPDRQAFGAALRAENGYQTPPDIRRPAVGRWDAAYYLQLFWIVIRAGRAARRSGYGRDRWFLDAVRTLRLVEACGGTVSVSGVEHVPGPGTPVVFTANHMSLIETFLLPGALINALQDVTIVLKTDLLRYPFFGRVLRGLGPITVTRRDPRADLRAVLRQGAERLGRGQSVLVFPQATRTAHFAPDAFNTLGVKLASRAGVPMVPIALQTDFQENGRWIKEVGPIRRARPVRFRFGAALNPGGNGRAAHAACVDFIARTLACWAAGQ
jgi:1-acyl-sn-glycerol-3-phosphate acyltransferase